ncbi:Cytochrome oxidase c subunit VIb family protein [Candida parapsilosis]|uniref:Cytochrome c oxidase assembly factor 6 n=2 Tax=Candida parapsilosis TaxID=5480 RepID=G8BEW0_CANPC|nr:uncharacterized protein CPAR2_200610 [Candida parapsilosis]KAF6055429.1 Cytochrome oxidase c subunit VIb family protein [Candida parapsilosis]KAF6055548.1 Cytochrome oxidase c subunit VIb family protein [Candida parapsilosis]KAF6058478.1 Cytochrome oxidase c subunit VIb family protein [Candida parapsilosis]KAF6067235.1 Cytochrome oxidase c subunit VIb family protein [Candida parapsilosis]KAI5903864.1 hypothetical protein K4G60_g3021 [Candida parapsilosis]
MPFFSKGEEVDIAPDKSARFKCWDKRDRFFQCLSENYIDNSLDPKELPKVNEKCGEIKKEFERDCVSSWVKYFQEKRYNDLVRQRYIAKLESEGAQPLPFKIESIKK